MNRILSFPKAHPFAFGVIVTAAKTSAVDAAVQKYVEKKEQIDWRRNAVFLSFGVTYLGVWQYLLFVKLMPRIVPNAAEFAAKSIREKLRDKNGLRGLLVQNFVENGINNPVLYFPCFYTLKEFVEGGDLSNGIKRYRSNMWNDLTAIWSVWVPAQFLNFSFSPMWFRVPFVACVSAGWTAYVSFTRGGVQNNLVEEELEVSSSVAC